MATFISILGLFPLFYLSGACIPTVTPDSYYEDEMMETTSVLLTSVVSMTTEGTSPATSSPTITATESTTPATSSTTTTIPLSCPAGWQLFEQSCYFLATTPMDWDDAELDCMMQGAHLASILSQEEQDFVISLSSSGLWFGLRGTSGFPNTYTDGSTVTYTHYQSTGTGTGCYGICNTMMCPTRTWQLVACNSPKLYVCKKPA